MYRCEGCEKLSEPGVRMNRVVVERRIKQYSNEGQRGQLVVTEGWETVQEAGVCAGCAETLTVRKLEGVSDDDRT